MKNLLLATTALVATAGVAAAEIKITGSASIGIVGGDAYGDNTQFWTARDINFSGSGEADNGLAFGMSVDLDEAANGDNEDDAGATWFLSYGALRLDMGDTDGAFDAALTEVGGPGTINDLETGHAGYSGNGGVSFTAATLDAAGNVVSPAELTLGTGLDNRFDGQIARVSYSASGFTGHFSLEVDDSGTFDPTYGLGVAYSMDVAGTAIGVGLGYQKTDEDVVYDSAIGVSLSATLAGGFGAVVNYSVMTDEENADGTELDDITHSAIGISYAMNALSVGVNYGQYAVDGDKEASGYAVSANYDLGGGLVVKGGYANSQYEDGRDDSDNFSLGLAMSF